MAKKKTQHFYELSVYNEARSLYASLRSSTQKMSREERYNFIIPVMNKIEGIMTTIAIATIADDKYEVLKPAVRSICEIQVTMRNLFELHLLTKKGFSSIAEHTEALRRQLVGWSKKYNGQGTGDSPESV